MLFVEAELKVIPEFDEFFGVLTKVIHYIVKDEIIVPKRSR